MLSGISTTTLTAMLGVLERIDPRCAIGLCCRLRARILTEIGLRIYAEGEPDPDDGPAYPGPGGAA